MGHFFVEPSAMDGEKIYVTGDNFNHIKNVLRMKVGDEVKLSSGDGLVYTSIIAAFMEKEIECRIVDCEGGRSELPSEIILFQGLPKKDKMELIIEKAVELGVKEIVPVMMKRTIVKLDDAKKEAKRLERWRTIALTAAKQSGRNIVPKVSEFVDFPTAIKRAGSLSYNLIPYENEKGMKKAREIILEAKGKESIGIFIGPEGGITDEEHRLAIGIGARSMSLGNRILRTETAGLALLSVLSFYLDT